ncbi:MAG TPA: arginine--tRNA ligase [Chthoniobacterales bacterium]|nr:arginine--tRNA ligase [Chthoniobacterales bacterium]
METFQAQLANKLSDALAKADLPDAGELTPATDPRFGDYQTNAALVLGKQRGKNPREIAAKILEHVDVGELSEQPTVAGAGFINFTLRPDAIAKKTTELLEDERLGVARTKLAKRIVIDFGSPNVAKPMHVGHIRSTVLGDALARIATFLGHEVIRDNHIGDWGTQFGLLIYAWKFFPSLRTEEQLQRDPMAVLERLYKYANAIAGGESDVQKLGSAAERRHAARFKAREVARSELVKLQSGDPENVSIWKQCVDLSMQEFERAYRLLDIHYDIQRGESFYNDRLTNEADRLLKSGIAEMSEGAVVVFFRDIPELADKPAIIRKKDGGFNYATTDIATVDYRVNDLKADTIWYVVGAPQILHFKQIFEIARRAGYTADFRHITFGSILGEDRKLMKTRSGENVPLRDLLNEAMQRARKIVEEKNPDLSDADKIDIAQKIGIGAVKYYDLSQYRMTDYVFSWDRMLALQGNTAPYLQNAYVRIRSIFRKAGESAPKIDNLVLRDAAESNLAKRLCQFAETVPQVLNDFRPNILANYLFELADNFHTFYEACPVLRSEEPVRSSRLALCNLTGRVLERGLDLLGIKVPEKM